MPNWHYAVWQSVYFNSVQNCSPNVSFWHILACFILFIFCKFSQDIETIIPGTDFAYYMGMMIPHEEIFRLTINNDFLNDRGFNLANNNFTIIDKFRRDAKNISIAPNVPSKI